MYTLIGGDGSSYQSPAPGSLGGHRRTRLYGRLDCPAALGALARGGYADQRVFFANEEAAVAAGYRPCARCLPAQYAHWRLAAAAPGGDSWASSAGVRRSMQGNRGRDTQPELAVRRLLHARGLRYRVDYRPESGLRRRADLVFTRARIAVFIDGCFWHGCPEHGTQPRTNSDYWLTKISANRARDDETTQRLGEAGWSVVRYWEHEDPAAVAAAIEAAVRARQ